MSLTSRPMWWMGELFLALLLGLVGVLVLGMIGLLNTGMSGLLAGFILASLPVPLYVLLALWIDRYEKEPFSMLALAFLWGATGAVFLALVANTINAVLFTWLVGEETAQLASIAISAPVVEETAKASALFLLFAWKRHEFDNVVDGILYATLVGLGFALMENVSYYGAALERGREASLVAFTVRGLLTPFAHPLFTAMAGIGLGVARESARPPVRLLAPALGLGAAIGLHALWNLATRSESAFLWTYALVMAPAFLGVVLLIVYSQRRERRIIRAHLHPYREAGVLAERELEALCAWGGRSRALWRAWRAGGWAGWRREAELHQAATELAFHHWRLRRGISRGADHDAAYEAEHLARLRQLTPGA